MSSPASPDAPAESALPVVEIRHVPEPIAHPRRDGQGAVIPLPRRPDAASESGAPLDEAPSLSSVLDALRREVPVGAIPSGSVPLPPHWELFHAVLGGARMRDVDLPASEAYQRAVTKGRHLGPGPHVIAGQTGAGKSALTCEAARCAVLAGHPVVYAALELDAEEIAARVVALHVAELAEREGVAGRALTWAAMANGEALSPELRQLRDRAMAELAGPLELLHCWSPDPGPGDPAPTARRLREIVLAAWHQHGHRTPLLIVDYLQTPGLYDEDPDEERRMAPRERLAGVFMTIRHLTKKRGRKATDDATPAWVGCPAIVLSTTARENVRGASALPGLDGGNPDELRLASVEALKALGKESGEIEATAVSSWALAVEATDAPTRRLTLRLAKHRKGPVGGWVPLTFDGLTGRLRDDPARYARAAEEDRARAEEQEERKTAAREKRKAVLDPQTRF